MANRAEQNGAGEAFSAEELLPRVYGELRKLAEARMARLAPGQTLQPTALVHEVYLKLIRKGDPGWDSDRHFFGAAAQGMREILVDHARRRSAKKRGAGHRRVETAEPPAEKGAFEINEEELLGIDAVMDDLRSAYPRKAEVVMLRYFAGMSNEHAAEVLGVASRTVERDWRFAQAWLHGRLVSKDEQP